LLTGNCQRGIAKEGLIELIGSLWGNGHCWLSPSLKAETLRKLKREHVSVQVWWDSTSLRAKTHYAKEKLREKHGTEGA
jgi:hypothetical protein